MAEITKEEVHQKHIEKRKERHYAKEELDDWMVIIENTPGSGRVSKREKLLKLIEEQFKKYHDDTKQDLLIAYGKNQNIKTVNGESILGKGNVNVPILKAGPGIQIDENEHISVVVDEGPIRDELVKKQNNIIDLWTIRRGAKLGATALQEVPAEYAKKSDIPSLDGYSTTKEMMFAINNYHDATKLDLITSKDTVARLYGVSASGKQVAFRLTSGNVPSTVAYRNESGQINVQDPTSPAHAANKRYVDNHHDTTKQDVLIAGENIVIEDNVISAVGGPAGRKYEAGNGIVVNNKNNIISIDESYTAKAEDLNKKQDVISDLEAIRSGAALGATALQSVPKEYAKKTDIPAVPTKTSELTNDSGFLTEHQSLEAYSTTSEMNTAIVAHHDSTKQDSISDLDTIRNNASKGATAIQPEEGKGLFSGNYEDLTNKPVIPSVEGLATETYVNEEAAKKQDKLVQGNGVIIDEDNTIHIAETIINNKVESKSIEAAEKVSTKVIEATGEATIQGTTHLEGDVKTGQYDEEGNPIAGYIKVPADPEYQSTNYYFDKVCFSRTITKEELKTAIGDWTLGKKDYGYTGSGWCIGGINVPVTIGETLDTRQARWSNSVYFIYDDIKDILNIRTYDSNYKQFGGLRLMLSYSNIFNEKELTISYVNYGSYGTITWNTDDESWYSYDVAWLGTSGYPYSYYISEMGGSWSYVQTTIDWKKFFAVHAIVPTPISGTQGSLEVNGTLKVYNEVDFYNNIDFHYATLKNIGEIHSHTLNTGASRLGETEIYGELDVRGAIYSQDTIYCGGGLQVEGQSTFAGTTSFGKDVKIEKSLEVTGTTRTKGDLVTYKIKPNENAKSDIGNNTKYYKRIYLKDGIKTYASLDESGVPSDEFLLELPKKDGTLATLDDIVTPILPEFEYSDGPEHYIYGINIDESQDGEITHLTIPTGLRINDYDFEVVDYSESLSAQYFVDKTFDTQEDALYEGKRLVESIANDLTRFTLYYQNETVTLCSVANFIAKDEEGSSKIGAMNLDVNNDVPTTQRTYIFKADFVNIDTSISSYEGALRYQVIDNDGTYSLALIYDANQIVVPGLDEKQDKLTAGANITIEKNAQGKTIISATGGSGEPEAYIKSAEVNGNKLTLTNKDNTTVEFTGNNDSYSLVKDSESGEYSAVYHLTKNGSNIGEAINIPKDMVVESGTVKTCTEADKPVAGYVVGDKYIDLVIANKESSHLYIKVSDLIDVYTEGNGIKIESNQISVDTDVIATKALVELKQDKIEDLATIKSGAALGATAVQPESGKGLFSGSYNDLTDKPTIPDASNLVTLDGVQTITGAKKFAGSSPNITITPANGSTTGTYSTLGYDGFTTRSGSKFLKTEYNTSSYANGFGYKMAVGNGTKYLSFPDKTGTLAMTSDIPSSYIKDATISDNKLTLTKQDNTTVEFAGGGGSGGVATAVSYITTAPTSDNPDAGTLKFVVLSSEPETKYSGYIYIITE